MTINGIFPHQEVSTDEIIAVTKHFSDATAERVIQRLQDTDDTERLKLILATVMTGDEDVTEELLTLEAYCPEETAPYDHNLHHLIAIIRGLHEHEQYRHAPLDLATGTELSKITALMNITSLLLRSFKNPPLVIENIDDHKTSKVWLEPEAANLVIKYHDEVPYLIDYLSEAPLTILQGLQYLNWYKKQSISTINDKTINTLFSYLYVTEVVRDHAPDEITSVGEFAIEAEHLNDQELESFIENNPNELEDFMLYIEERGITEVGGYYAHKNNGTALRIGAL
jgi:hypothetical protein